LRKAALIRHCHPAGQAEAHYIDNTGTEACTYLIVGERIGDDEVVYPSGS